MEPIAVKNAEMKQWGCPSCGYRSGHNMISGRDGALWKCGECGYTCVILADGILESPYSFENANGSQYYPTLKDHPRHGIPAHGKLDKRPEGGGEFFYARGIGLDNCTCFVCDLSTATAKDTYMMNNIAAFVETHEAGDRVAVLFGHGARVDYRPWEPDRVQVKVGACDDHLANLNYLYQITGDGIITSARIQQAREFA